MLHPSTSWQGHVYASLCQSQAFVTILLGLASNSDWGDPWVDPQGILGGSNPNSGDPAILTHVKIGGSSETTSPLYNIKKGINKNLPASLRILIACPPPLEFYSGPSSKRITSPPDTIKNATVAGGKFLIFAWTRWLKLCIPQVLTTANFTDWFPNVDTDLAYMCFVTCRFEGNPPPP